jgi:DNA repair protein RadC
MRKSYTIIPASTQTMRRSAIVYNGREFSDYVALIRDMADEDKPREKLIAHGPEALSERELLSIILQVGTTKEDVAEISDRIIRGYGDSVLAERNPTRLSDEAGIPIVKACQIVAVGEIGRRVYEKHETGLTVLKNAKDVYEYLTDMRNLSKECLRGLFLNSRNRLIRNEVISVGSVSESLVNPREVFRPGIESSALAVILAHNHPSGELAPSREDVRITEQLVQAGKILGIHVLDHVIITKGGFVSVPVNYQ